MNINELKKIYLKVGSGRLLDIKVILDEKEVYNGMIEDASEEIKKLKYSNVEMGSKITYYVYSELQ